LKKRRVTGIRISSVSLDGIARSAGLNRPSLAAAFGDKDAIYAKAAAQYVAMIDARVSEALSLHDLGSALRAAFDAAIDIYTAGGPDGCFVICTAPAEALDQSLEKIDAAFLSRLQRDKRRVSANPDELPLVAALLGATLYSLALRARAGWSRKRLRSLAAGAIRQVIGET
jgi:TetR/AcrR family transcriptional regulator, copper-responsive repressor